MTIKNQVYKCGVCGNMVELTHTGVGQLVCCGQDMNLQEANTVDAAKEKHVPVIEKTETGYKIKVGEVAHPMTEEHFIEWIELIVDNEIMRVNLNPGDAPEAVFETSADKVTVRAYCNLHGLWEQK
jgi:superoxide reductase